MHNNNMTHTTHDLVTETERLVRTQGLTAKDAKRLADQYRERWPDVGQFFDDMSDLIASCSDDKELALTQNTIR
ncbi:hypothetical protein EVB91_174 [Rhizobium phage RHph_I1_18]|nr:hypothetical protein EVB91_174 [Rhizobium phage RHph_I1_18]